VVGGYGRRQYRIDPDTGEVIGPAETVRPELSELLANLIPHRDVARDLMAAARGDPVGARYSATGDVNTDETGEARSR
jgi:hypothetical protein